MRLKKFYKSVFIFSLILFIGIALSGCGKHKEPETTEYLLKTDMIILTKADFSEELELKRAAYPYDIMDNAAEYNEMIIDLVRILSEEIVLLSHAKHQSITVTEQDYLDAESKIKEDYPNDSFEQMLLKNAVSYEFWKKRFKRELVIDKLIDTELRDKIKIGSNEIVAFYDQYKKDLLKNKKNEDKAVEINENDLIKQLRMKKTEILYEKWIDSLSSSYPVAINKEILKSYLIGMK